MIKRLITILLSIGLITSSIGWLNMHNKVGATEKIVSEKEKEIEEQLTEIANLENEVAYNNTTIEELKNTNSIQTDELQKKEAELTARNNEINRLKEELKKKNESNLGKFEMTSYIALCREGCSGITRVGYDVRNTTTYNGMRIVATDPSIIPLWSIVRIHTENGSFDAIALDTGGGIDGKELDFLVGSESEAIKNGRQIVSVEMIRRGK